MIDPIYQYGKYDKNIISIIKGVTGFIYILTNNVHEVKMRLAAGLYLYGHKKLGWRPVEMGISWDGDQLRWGSFMTGELQRHT